MGFHHAFYIAKPESESLGVLAFYGFSPFELCKNFLLVFFRYPVPVILYVNIYIVVYLLAPDIDRYRRSRIFHGIVDNVAYGVGE